MTYAQTAMFQPQTIEKSSRQLKVREMPESEQPRYRANFYGLGSLSSSELMQLIGGFSYMETGGELLKSAGSLAALNRMPTAEMCKVEGVGPAAALAIKAALELAQRLITDTSGRPQITSPADAANLLMARYGNKDQEHFAVMMLDTKNRVIGIETIYIGTVNGIQVRNGEVFRPAIMRNATAIILCHNHPSGDPTPSPEDVTATRLMVEAGRMMDIEVLDHIVVGQDRFVSLKERNLGFD